jgi:hypothetical protein
MLTRRDSLDHALVDVEGRALRGASTIVVSRSWWDSLSPREQSEYRSRAARADIALRVDEAISPHFVEVRGGEEDPPLSTEHPL